MKVAWTQAEEQRLLEKLAQEEQLVQELRASERRMTATITKTHGKVADLILFVQSERQQTEEAKAQSRNTNRRQRLTRRKSEP